MSEKEKEAQKEKGDEQNERMNAFIQEYGELVKKHGFDFAAYPMWVPDGEGSFKCIVRNTPVDVQNAPQKSPFVGEEKA